MQTPWKKKTVYNAMICLRVDGPEGLTHTHISSNLPHPFTFLAIGEVLTCESSAQSLFNMHHNPPEK